MGSWHWWNSTHWFKTSLLKSNLTPSTPPAPPSPRRNERVGGASLPSVFPQGWTRLLIWVKQNLLFLLPFSRFSSAVIQFFLTNRPLLQHKLDITTKYPSWRFIVLLLCNMLYNYYQEFSVQLSSNHTRNVCIVNLRHKQQVTTGIVQWQTLLQSKLRQNKRHAYHILKEFYTVLIFQIMLQKPYISS